MNKHIVMMLFFFLLHGCGGSTANNLNDDGGNYMSEFGLELLDGNNHFLLADSVEPLTFKHKVSVNSIPSVDQGGLYSIYTTDVDTGVNESKEAPVVYYVPANQGGTLFGITRLFKSNGTWHVTIIAEGSRAIELYIFSQRDVLEAGYGLSLNSADNLLFNNNDRFLFVKEIHNLSRGADNRPDSHHVYYGVDSVDLSYSGKIAISVPVYFNQWSELTSNYVYHKFGAVQRSNTSLELKSALAGSFNWPISLYIRDQSYWDDFTVTVIDANLYD